MSKLRAEAEGKQTGNQSLASQKLKPKRMSKLVGAEDERAGSQRVGRKLESKNERRESWRSGTSREVIKLMKLKQVES